MSVELNHRFAAVCQRSSSERVIFYSDCHVLASATAETSFVAVQIATGEAEHSQEISGVTAGSPANDTAAALIASLITSVLEAPVELFRHRMQVAPVFHTMTFEKVHSRNLEHRIMILCLTDVHASKTRQLLPLPGMK